MPANGLSREKAAKRLRLVPAQGAAEDAAAASQFHRNEIVIGSRKPRTGKADKHTAVFDPVGQPVVSVAGNVAHIGQDQHRKILIEEMGYRIGR